MTIRLYMDHFMPDPVKAGLRRQGVIYAHQLNITIGRAVRDRALLAHQVL